MENKLLILIMSIIFLFAISCGKKQTGDDAKKTGFGIEKEYASGPCTLTVRVDKKEISIAESITMIIEVTADKEFNITLPAFGENLDQFRIADFSEPGRKLIDKGKISVQQTYKLEPYLSGEYKIPIMRIKFYTDAESPENAHIIESEELTITVTSLLPEDMKDLAIADITAPVTPPAPDMTWVNVSAALILTAVGAFVILVFRLKDRKKGKFIISTIPAHELAYRLLEALVREDFISQGKFRHFYTGISTILRRYIENRFSLHAPEQTTEEFLSDLHKNPLLPGELKSILGKFLHHCDLVKFARYTPETGDIQNTFDTCRDFIVKTADDAARVPEPDAIRLDIEFPETEEGEGY